MKTVAVIQPYFFPYAGYFRLFAAADVVVMFDCVQFPRRGWVHRNRFPLESGELDWLTLPLEKAPRDARIAQLRFRKAASDELRLQIGRFPVLTRALERCDPLLMRMLLLRDEDVTTYLCETVADTAERLDLGRPMVRSSTLEVSPDARGQDRVIQIVKLLGGTRYVNPSGGRELYDHDAFERAGLELRFLSEFNGSMQSICSRLIGEPTEQLRAEIVAQTTLSA